MTTPDVAQSLKASVLEALSSVRSQYGCDEVRAVPDGQGGAWIEIAGVELGAPYRQDDTSVICLLPFTLPNADVYPVFLRADLTRLDDKQLGEGFQVAEVQLPDDPAPRPVVQVSRRTRNGLFTAQTAAQKIDKVLSWVRSQ